MGYFIFPQGSVSHTSPLEARLDSILVAPYLPSGLTIQWRRNGISLKEGSTDDSFYRSINTTTSGDVTFNASNTGSIVDFIIDPYGTPVASSAVVLTNNAPTLSGSGPVTDAYGRTLGLPTLVWTYADADNDPQYYYRIKLGTVAGGSQHWDSGIVISTTQTATMPSSPIPVGSGYHWQIEVTDGEQVDPFDTNPSPDRVTVVASGTSIVNTPPVVSALTVEGLTGGATIRTVTPTFSWAYVDVDGQPQQSYRIVVARDVGLTDVLWDSGFVTGADTSAEYNFNLTGTDIESHRLLYVAVTAMDTFEVSNTAMETFIVSCRPVITTVTVDNKVNPLNVRNASPFFNWLYVDEDEDPLVAYEIRVADNDTDLGTDSFIGNVWHPGVITTPESYMTQFNTDGTAFPGCVIPNVLQSGTKYYFQVQIHDLSDFSEWAVGCFKLNTAPTAANLSIIPSAPFNSDELLAKYDFVDDVGDIESSSTQIRWFRKPTGGSFEEITSVRNLRTVSPDLTVPGDQWKFTVRPHDGVDYSILTYESAVATIINRAPTASALAILPSNPQTGDDLEAIFSLSDPDEDDVSARISWFKNDVEQPALRNVRVIPASLTAVDEEWHFTILPSDGYDNGPLAISSKVKVLNTPPIITSMTVEGLFMPVGVKSANPTIAWAYQDADLQPQTKYHVLIGTKPVRSKRIVTDIRTRALSVGSAATGTSVSCGNENGIVSTAKSNGTVVSGNEVFDSGVIDSSNPFYKYITEDFVQNLSMSPPDFETLTGYEILNNIILLRPTLTNGSAIGQFNGISGFYDVVLTYLKEETKRATYKLFVDGTVVGQVVSQLGTGPASHTFNSVRIDPGMPVGILGVATDDGSKASFTSLKFNPITQLDLNAGSFRTLSGYLQDGTGGIKLAGLAGTATTSFAFPSGTYDIELVYVTETTGNPNLTLSQNNSVLLSFAYESGAKTRSKFLQGIEITTGDTIKISGTRNAGAVARVKKIIFRPTETVKAGSALKPGIRYFASVRVFDGREWSEWHTTSFIPKGSAWVSGVSNAKGWTIEVRMSVTKSPEVIDQEEADAASE